MMNLGDQEIEFKLNMEFFLQPMTAQDRTAWMADINAGLLPATAYYAALRAAGVTDWTDEDIKDAIEVQASADPAAGDCRECHSVWLQRNASHEVNELAPYIQQMRDEVRKEVLAFGDDNRTRQRLEKLLKDLDNILSGITDDWESQLTADLKPGRYKRVSSSGDSSVYLEDESVLGDAVDAMPFVDKTGLSFRLVARCMKYRTWRMRATCISPFSPKAENSAAQVIR
ncbi:hypothetical protein GH714_044134 [Hevea brasiliensis]|uniref:Uncharacterized protein n=1 Tax=Hevea brasiliensis TaxID=3981 RepID=A0A6A6K0F1_HEVBR|nr:hypothetical protein GH714_044134 [Hevea brasiliensis]